MFNSVILGKISEVSTIIINSFNFINFDKIGYTKTAFSTRHRHFSCFDYKDGKFRLGEKIDRYFNRKKDFHEIYLDEKLFPIDDEAIIEIKELLGNLLAYIPIKPRDYFYGVNQVRVVSDGYTESHPAPFLHQDGYKFSCHLCINRHNIEGGISKLSYSEKEEHIFLQHQLSSGEFVFFDDEYYHHTATPIKGLQPGQIGYRDMIIIDFVSRKDE